MNQLPQSLNEAYEIVIELADIKSTSYNTKGDLAVLVMWTGLSSHEQTWMRVKDLSQQFPSYHFEGKLSSPERVLICHEKYTLGRKGRIDELAIGDWLKDELASAE